MAGRSASLPMGHDPRCQTSRSVCAGHGGIETCTSSPTYPCLPTFLLDRVTAGRSGGVVPGLKMAETGIITVNPTSYTCAHQDRLIF